MLSTSIIEQVPVSKNCDKESDNLSSFFDIKVASTLEEFESLREQWNIFNDNSPKGTLFVSWEWLYTWWEIYENDGNRTLYILTCYDHNKNLIGIAPFQIINNPKRYFPCSRQLILLGTGETDGSFVFGEYMDLLIEAGYESAVIYAFSEYLYKNRSLWDGVKFNQLLAESHLSRLFKDHPQKVIKTTRPLGFRTFIILPETYKDYLMGLRKKMRNNITRTFSRLEANEPTYSIESVDNVNDIDGAISILADLNRSRRTDMDKYSVFEQINFENFHRKISKRLLPLNKIRLTILRFGDEPVAALYSFVDGKTIHAYQSGFEKENGQRYSLLTTMLTQEISRSIDDPDLLRFNFMYSDEETTYKRRYSGTAETMYDISYDKSSMKFRVYSFIHGPVKEGVKKVLKIT